MSRGVDVNFVVPSVSRRLRASNVAVVEPALVRLPAASHSYTVVVPFFVQDVRRVASS
ncbi:hypothetical protein [Streptomyces actuosus]|uniref:hypothetical protein n=1 Tax=Streptomyces actuosus TaxID=1885 RepID=UPI001F05F4A1|nr:hypothetical protein [Streptomyces actuosus]